MAVPPRADSETVQPGGFPAPVQEPAAPPTADPSGTPAGPGQTGAPPALDQAGSAPADQGQATPGDPAAALAAAQVEIERAWEELDAHQAELSELALQLAEREAALATAERNVTARESAMKGLQAAFARLAEAFFEGSPPDELLQLAGLSPPPSAEQPPAPAGAVEPFPPAGEQAVEPPPPAAGDAELPPPAARATSTDADQPPAAERTVSDLDPPTPATERPVEQLPSAAGSVDAGSTPPAAGVRRKLPAHKKPDRLVPGPPPDPSSSAPLPTAPAIDGDQLAPEIRQKLRIMRRLTGGRVPDAELLARIRKDAGAADGDAPPAGKPKRRWWGG